jgi:glutamyl-tRNA reductase
MRLHLWGTDFRRSSPELRAKLYRAPEAREKTVRDLLALGFDDLVYLSTCNRVEFFTTARDFFSDTRPLWLKLLGYFGLDEEAFYRGYHLEGKSAVRHLLRVSSSLESMVIGEPQILGQLKEAVRWTKESQLPLERSLERTFHLAFETAKKVRASTAIGERPVSVATLGLKYLQAHEAQYPLRRVVVVGRSPISVLTVQWLQKNRPQSPILWINRTVDALRAIPESAGTELMALEAFLREPPAFSHLITATGATTAIFDGPFFERVAARSAQPRALIFDFAQPPDVERGAPCECVATVLHLEDFLEEARENASARARAVWEAEQIIEMALRDHCLEQKEAPVLRDFNRVEPSLWEELSQALQAIETDFPPEMQPKLKKWAEKLVKKNLHHSREHLRTVLRQVTEPEESALFV